MDEALRVIIEMIESVGRGFRNLVDYGISPSRRNGTAPALSAASRCHMKRRRILQIELVPLDFERNMKAFEDAYSSFL